MPALEPPGEAGLDQLQLGEMPAVVALGVTGPRVGRAEVVLREKPIRLVSFEVVQEALHAARLA